MPDAPDPKALKNLPPRHAALSAVMAVHKSGAALEGGLAGHPDWKRMAARDRGFARAIATAAIRRDGALRAALDALIERPLPDKALKARMILLCGAAERLVLDGAAHAVVDGWVSLMANDASTRNYKNLANAVLRRAASGPARAAFENADPLDDLPAWLHRRWVACYGEATARAMAAARSGPPPLDLTCKPGVDAAALAEVLSGEILPTGTVRRAQIGAVEDLPGFEAGEWWVQDAAAALPVRLLAPKPGEVIADLCAAPGGKTLQLAASGARTIAVEASAKRMKRVAANLTRTGLSAEMITADAVAWRPEAPLDGVLLDAPCTATGTLRRRPDAAFAKQDGDVANLARIQDALLDAAADMVRPGGRIVYCTCSLEAEEGEARIAAALARRSNLRRDPVRADAPPGLAEAITADGAVRTRPDLWAGRGGLDGFYMARLVKA